MPLMARVDGVNILSIDLSAVEFDALRRRRDLMMACCETQAVAKRSVNGLPFFAHAQRKACEYASETEFHLKGKALIREAARAAGWQAEVEVSGQSPQGERWRADVLCVSGTRRVAFEMQHSGLSLANLGERQARYQASGVRGMWFMRTHERRLGEPQVWQQATPALYVTEQHWVPSLKLPLGDVVHLALRGELIHFPAGVGPLCLTAVAHFYPCRWCKSSIGVLARVLLAPVGQPDFFIEADWTVKGLRDWTVGLLERSGSCAQLLQRKEHRAYNGSVYDCPSCHKRLYVHQRPPENLKDWRKVAADDSAVLTAGGGTAGSTAVIKRNEVWLTPTELEWFKDMVGGRWILRRWL